MERAGNGGDRVTEQELSVKMTETEERIRANADRLTKMEQRQDDLEKLVTAVEVLAVRQRSVEDDVKEIKTNVKCLAEKPAKRWDAVVDRVIYLAVGAAVSLMLTGNV